MEKPLVIDLSYDRESGTWVARTDTPDGVRIVEYSKDPNQAERKVKRQLAARFT